MQIEKSQNSRPFHKLISIEFVCHGNICRSPLAEFIFRDLVNRSGLGQQFHIASAATSTEEIGNPVYPPAKRKLLEHGISCDGKHAIQLKRNDYQEYDYLLGMEERNIINMKRIFGGDPDGKVFRLLDFSSRPRNIADPWYTGDFDTAYEDIKEGCEAFLDFLKERGESETL